MPEWMSGITDFAERWRDAEMREDGVGILIMSCGGGKFTSHPNLRGIVYTLFHTPAAQNLTKHSIDPLFSSRSDKSGVCVSCIWAVSAHHHQSLR